MKTYLIINKGIDIETDTVETPEELRRLAKIGNLKIYTPQEVEQSLELKIRVLAYFGSQALKEITQAKAQLAELIIGSVTYGNSRINILKRVKEFIKV